MVMLGVKSKTEDDEDDYTCPACGIPRLAWQMECSECGRKFDDNIEVKSDEELKNAHKKAKDAETHAKKKKGYWRNLDPNELKKIKNSLYVVEIVFMILILINLIYTNLTLDPFYLPIGIPLFFILLFAIIFTIEGLWFKYLEIIRARSYKKRLAFIKEFRLGSQTTLVVCIILLIIIFSFGIFQFVNDMLTTENEVYLEPGQSEKFTFESQDPLGLTEVNTIDLTLNRSVDSYLMAEENNGDVLPSAINSTNYSLSKPNLNYDLEAPGFQLDFASQEEYVLWVNNGDTDIPAKGDYTINRELSKPLLLNLILFCLLFIIISVCWLVFLQISKKYYAKLFDEKIEELTSKYKIEPYTIEDIFLVYRDGTLITHQTRRLKTLDDDIFMGMLTSIKDFVKDAMRNDAKGELNELVYGKLKIMIEYGAYVFLAIVVSGKPPNELRKQMKGTVKRIHKTHLSTLRSWDGNIGKLEPAKKIINELIIKDTKGTGNIPKFDMRSESSWNDRGVVLTKIGKYKEAISCFDRAIKINPKVSEVWSNKGIVLYKRQKYERAMKCFDKALQLNPYNKKANRRRDKCWYKLQLKGAKSRGRARAGEAQPPPVPKSLSPRELRGAGAASARDRQPIGTPLTATSSPRGRAAGIGHLDTSQSQSAGEEPCPDCGHSMRFTFEYNDWWCDNCDRYPYEEETGTREHNQEPPSEKKYFCETCGRPLSFIEDYQEWYCDHCEKYA